jgi:hypothetical protein
MVRSRCRATSGGGGGDSDAMQSSVSFASVIKWVSYCVVHSSSLSVSSTTILYTPLSYRDLEPNSSAAIIFQQSFCETVRARLLQLDYYRDYTKMAWPALFM